MKKIILSLLLGMVLISLVIATTWNTFTTGLTEENISFSGTESHIRNLSIPDGTYLINTSITLKGYQDGSGNYPTNFTLKIGDIIAYNYSIPSNIFNNTIVYLNLDGTSGNVLDSTGNTFGINNGSTRGESGILNNAFNFTASELDHIKVNHTEELNFGSGNWSYSFWLDPATLQTEGVFISTFDGTTGYTIRANTGNLLSVFIDDGVDPMTADCVGCINTTGWHHYAVTFDGSQDNVSFYIDGNYNSSSADSDIDSIDNANNLTIGCYLSSSQCYDGLIDEIGVWNKKLNASEISSLYNSGIALGYSTNSEFNIETTFNLTDTLNNYISSCTAVSGNCTIPFNFTATNGNLSYSDLVFTNDGFIENSQTYSSETTELSFETFSINISYDSSIWTSITGILNYDGTNYTATSSTGSGNTRIFSRDLNIPEVTSQTTKSFYWLMRFTNSTGTYFYSSTINNQTVNNINIDDCSAYSYKLLNLTLRDEETQNLIENGTIEVNVDLYNQLETLTIDYYNKFEDDSNVAICLDNNLTGASLYLDAKIKYYSEDHSTEYYNIKNYVLNFSSLTQNITLYDLNKSSTTTFDIYYKDDNFNIVPDALIQITREYVEEGVFKTVEIPLTDIDGKTTASLIKDEGIYTFYVYEDGELKATFNNVIPTCENELTEQCQINLNEPSSTTTIEDYVNLNDLNYNIQYNKDTRIITFDYSIPSGTSSELNLLVDLFDEYENETICDESVNSASGTLTCTIPGTYVNSTAIIKIYKDNSFVSSYFISLKQDATDYFGYSGLLFALIMIIMIPFMFVTSVIGVVVGLMIGIIMASLLLLSTGANIYSVTGGIIWFIVAGIILIWKLNSTERKYG